MTVQEAKVHNVRLEYIAVLGVHPEPGSRLCPRR